jgi:hypothetical protein
VTFSTRPGGGFPSQENSKTQAHLGHFNAWCESPATLFVTIPARGAYMVNLSAIAKQLRQERDRIERRLHGLSGRRNTRRSGPFPAMRWPRSGSGDCPQQTLSCPVHLQAVRAGTLEIRVLGNLHMAALLANKPVRPLQHGSELIVQNAVRAAHALVSHDSRSHSNGRILQQ